jgi:secondary thiamine-phosphate synthase enzyme
MIVTEMIYLKSRGHGDMIDITDQVSRHLEASGLKDGTVTVFINGSTAGVTTIEYEPGLVADFQRLWTQITPEHISYEHDRRWGDGNGYAHVRASLLGPSLAVPFSNRRLSLGTWQQIVAVDFDNRARSRQIVLQFMGE